MRSDYSDLDLHHGDNGSERMIELLYIPSYKLLAFNTGPVMPRQEHHDCLDDNIAATMVWNFDVEVLIRYTVNPDVSVFLQMKNDLMVKVKKRGK